MRALYVEGLATHDGPESCVSTREGEGEALTGVHAGQPWSREITTPGCRRRRTGRKAIPPAALSQAAGGPCAVEEPVHAWNLHAREPGDPMTALPSEGCGPLGEGVSRTPEMYDHGKSDCPIVCAGRCMFLAGESPAGPFSKRGP